MKRFFARLQTREVTDVEFYNDILQCTSGVSDKITVGKLLGRSTGCQFASSGLSIAYGSLSTFFSTIAHKQFSEFYTGKEQPS